MFGHLRKWFLGEASEVDPAKAWYSEIMAKAREPRPFQIGAVDDTLEGRFAMVSLVSTLVLRTLREVGPEGRELADGVYREVFSGFDYGLREEGVGDSSIARKIRKMGEEFFGLARAVDAVLLGESDERLPDVLERNGVANRGYGQDLSDWAQARISELEALDAEALMKADIGWVASA
ncbi:MAG: ubiquinol-cytochrome C chaperone family protein [Pseudomonadota bacterium]